MAVTNWQALQGSDLQPGLDSVRAFGDQPVAIPMGSLANITERRPPHRTAAATRTAYA